MVFRGLRILEISGLYESGFKAVPRVSVGSEDFRMLSGETVDIPDEQILIQWELKDKVFGVHCSKFQEHRFLEPLNGFGLKCITLLTTTEQLA